MSPAGNGKAEAELLCATFLIKEHLHKHLPALTIPTTPSHPDREELPGLSHASATNWIKMIKKEAAHQTFDDSVNKKPFFFLGMWTWGVAPRLPTNLCPQAPPPESPWQAGQVAFSKWHNVSHLLCFSPM